MTNNRRQFVRVTPSGIKEMDAKIHLGAADIPCLVNDISEGGLGLRVISDRESLELFQRVKCTIVLPDSSTPSLTLKAEVRHVRDELIGIQFAWLDKQNRNILHRFIAENLDGVPFMTKVKFSFGLLR